MDIQSSLSVHNIGLTCPCVQLALWQVGPSQVVLYFTPMLFRQGNLDGFQAIIERIQVRGLNYFYDGGIRR